MLSWRRLCRNQELLIIYLVLIGISTICITIDINHGSLFFTSILAFMIAIFSIVILSRERFSIDLHIAKVRLFIEDASDTSVNQSPKKNQYRIIAQISNEGGRIAKECYCYIQSSDQSQKEELSFVPVDTDVGRLEPLPEKSAKVGDKFELLPKKHIFVRGYIKVKRNKKYRIFLTDGKNIVTFPDKPFEFPPWGKLRNAQNRRRRLGLPPIPF